MRCDPAASHRASQLRRYTLVIAAFLDKYRNSGVNYSVDHQLCRWLLLSVGRLSSDKLTMTPGTDRQHARRDQVPPWRDCGVGPTAVGTALLRMLWRGQDRNRPP